MRRGACLPLLALAALALASCFSLASAQLGLVAPKPRVSGEQQFNPRSNANQARDDYCGSSTAATALEPASSLLTGEPANWLLTTFNNRPSGDNATIDLTLLQYRQNGTTFNPANNVTTPIWVRGGTWNLSSTPADLRAGNNQRYLTALSLPPGVECGYKATVDPTFTQTRCVLRWVYNNSASGQASRVSCADVLIASRAADVRVSVVVRPDAGESSIQPQTALNRLLSHAWATDAARRLDIFTPPDGSSTKVSNQVRMHPTNPVVSDAKAGTYTINFVLSDTPAASAGELANSLRSQDLSLMFALNVVGSSQGGLNAATNAQAGLLLVFAACLASFLAKRAL